MAKRREMVLLYCSRSAGFNPIEAEGKFIGPRPMQLICGGAFPTYSVYGKDVNFLIFLEA